MGGAYLDSLFAESALDCPLVGVHAFGDLGGGPAVLVESRRLVDLFGEQAGSAHRHVVPSQYPADCLAVDSEQVAQFVHRCSGLVPGDEFLDLVGVELARPPWFGAVCGWRSRFSRVWQLPEQCLQGVYLGFCVVVSSPKVHQRF